MKRSRIALCLSLAALLSLGYRSTGGGAGSGGSGGAGFATQVTSTGSPTTTSATYVTLTSMTQTPGFGNYLVHFSTTWETDSGSSATNCFAVFVDGTIEQASERCMINNDDAQPKFVGIIGYKISVGTAEVVDIRWNTDTGTLTAHDRNFTLPEVR